MVPVTLVQEVIRRAEARPDALAVSCADGDLLYRDLDARSAELAAELGALGIGPDLVVGILLDRSPAMIVAALAVLRAGGAYLPVDPSSPGRWIDDLMADADISALIAEPSGRRFSFEASRRLITIDSLGRRTAGEFSLPADPPGPRVVTPKNLAYVIFTSGSTGRPKGVEITHAGLSNLVQWHREAFQVTAEDRTTQVARVGFDAAVWEIWPHLAAGASLHLPPDDLLAQPEAFRDWLVSGRITMSFAPTPLAERLITLPWPKETKLRALLTGADTLHRYPPADLPFTLVNNYGPTECSVVATSCSVPPATAPRGLPPIGRPIANTRAYILDASLRPVPQGVPGELHLGGPGVARGYRNRPDLTNHRFIRSPFGSDSSERLFRTGDLVRSLPDGQIAFLGRMDDQVKIRGFRVEPEQVAAAIDSHPSVAESVVAAREFAGGEKRLVAYLVPRPGARVPRAELRDFLAARLPDYMVPAEFVKLEALPLAASGKVDRAKLPAPNEANLLKDAAFAPPRTGTEKAVAAILAPLLGIGQVDANANFFALGGHSLLGTQLIVRLRDALGVEVALRTIFEAPTVAQLSSEIDRQLLARLDAMADAPTGDRLVPHRQC
jgi:amino acid adenylation domain-containing protein